MEEGNDSEQISDHFICAVCLDVLYKPIVLVCGHVSCFWCCQQSMHMRRESYCPLCRHPYHHFPSICQMLHFMLKKMYPISYNRRKTQTLEDEKQNSLGSSPDIDSEELNHLNNMGQSSNLDYQDNLSIDPSSNEEKKLNEGSSSGTCKQVSVTDVLCASCKQLLFRPVVLNCGHVYCVACITIPTEGTLKCQVCECRHPSGFPKVFKHLDHFLEEQFSSIYAMRRSSIEPDKEQIRNSTSSIEPNTQVPKICFPTEENFFQWWTVHGSKFHVNVGCDMCGMCPIIGDRYQCKDCTEISGYDLCGECYNTGSKLPGRFNQKHTPEHQLERVKPDIDRDVIYSLVSGQMALVSSAAFRMQANLSNGTPPFASPTIHDDDDDDVGGGDGGGGGGDDGGSPEAPTITGDDQSDNEA